MGGLLTFFGLMLAIVCMVFPANVAPRVWATLALLSMVLVLAGLPTSNL